MSVNKTGENNVNGSGTSGQTDENLTHVRSGLVRCFLAIDKRGRVRGRYRFARLAILEASENGWELQMSGCE